MSFLKLSTAVESCHIAQRVHPLSFSLTDYFLECRVTDVHNAQRGLGYVSEVSYIGLDYCYVIRRLSSVTTVKKLTCKECINVILRETSFI